MEEIILTGPLKKWGPFEILPCPLCGNRDIYFGQLPPEFFIKCIPCGLIVKQDRRDKVVGIWDQRVDKKSEEKKTSE